MIATKIKRNGGIFNVTPLLKELIFPSSRAATEFNCSSFGVPLLTMGVLKKNSSH